jgi:hypothetical protein
LQIDFVIGGFMKKEFIAFLIVLIYPLCTFAQSPDEISKVIATQVQTDTGNINPADLNLDKIGESFWDARITGIEGNVEIKASDLTTGKWMKLVGNIPIKSEDEIKTIGRNSFVRIAFDSRGVIEIGSDSQVKFNSLSYTEMNMVLVSGTLTGIFKPIDDKHKFSFETLLADFSLQTPLPNEETDHRNVVSFGAFHKGEPALFTRAGVFQGDKLLVTIPPNNEKSELLGGMVISIDSSKHYVSKDLSLISQNYVRLRKILEDFNSIKDWKRTSFTDRESQRVRGIDYSYGTNETKPKRQNPFGQNSIFEQRTFNK